jgi:predicted ArsR family transcriptional regulator/anti-sigma regulatory factor (Ser/Thr protein kinase)
MSSYLRRHGSAESPFDEADSVFGELLANAQEHAPGPVWINVEWSRLYPRVTIYDLGPGFELPAIAMPEPHAARGRGLAIATAWAHELLVQSRRSGGTKVSAVLPVERKPETSFAQQPGASTRLPTTQEAREDGTFGRESFLRAIVVELAQQVEAQEGPAQTESFVARVGANIGERMEQEYRQARKLIDPLTPDQISDLYVRLKAAIDGDFYPIEITPERIVLGNRRCPFGDAVKASPGLCRMTSSVFGGIAARNTGAAAVQLEERIAVGDPECRVVVWLGEAAQRARDSDYAHLYTNASEA